MTEPTFELVATVPSHCTLGEGPVWDERLQCLWFVDILESKLLRLDGADFALTSFTTPERLCCFGLTQVRGRLVCAFASGFAYFEPENGKLGWIAKTEPDYRGIRMNDGRLDRQGRFWAGSMVEDESLAPPSRGALYRLDPGAAAPVTMFDGVSISNSTCFSPSGDRLYFADTPSHEIGCFELDVADGSIGNRGTFATLAEDAFPDGSDVDAEGRLWNAEWGTGRVTAYNPDGSAFAKLEVPASQATCVTFGGPDLDLLFVTSARAGLTDEKLLQEPDAGSVFIYKAPVKGLPAPIFAA